MAQESVATPTRVIPASAAKANFGQVVDDVYSRGTRYLIQRFESPRAVLISLADYQRLLAAEAAGLPAVREARPAYRLGEERTPEEIAALLGTTEGEPHDA